MATFHMGEDGFQQEIRRLWKAIKDVSRATMQNSSIGRAGLRVYDAGRILFQGGGGVQIEDDGFIQIDGDLTGAGDFEWTGPWEFLGNGEVSGDVDWSGDIDLTGTITVAAGGEIVVDGSQPIRLGESGGAARITMGSGGSIWSTGDGISMSNASVGGIVRTVGDGVDILAGTSSQRVWISGNIELSTLGPPPSGATTAPIVIDLATGRLYIGS